MNFIKVGGYFDNFLFDYSFIIKKEQELNFAFSIFGNENIFCDKIKPSKKKQVIPLQY